jgi:STE24 endopeptidase
LRAGAHRKEFPMDMLAAVLIAALLASAALGVYLRLRQIATVDARRDHVPADFAPAVTLEEHHRAADYTIARTRLAIGDTLYQTVLSLLWLLVWLAPLYALIARVTEPGLTRSVAIVVAFAAISTVLDLPLALIETFRVDARFGFTRTSVGLFLLDRVKSLALEAALGVPLLYGLFALFVALPTTWWLLGFVGLLLVMVGMMVIYPTFIAPLFNKFAPLPEGELTTRLEALLAKCGFESKGLYVMDASRRSARGNAYFTGFGKAKRIVFFDTLLDKHTPDEVLSILAHELGHFKFGHVRQRLLLTAALLFLGFAALYWALSPAGLAASFGLPFDAGLALVLALIVKEPLTHLLSPPLSYFSRKAEFEADDFARAMVGREPMISALTRLTRDNLATLTPDDLYAAFYYSHPPAPVRIAHLRAA